MKTLKMKRENRLRFLAFSILAIIAVMLACFGPEAGLGLSTAMAVMVGGVELTGKDEAVFLAMKEANDRILNKLEREYISETKANEMLLASVNGALEKAGLAKMTDFDEIKALYDKLSGHLEQQGLAITEIKATVTQEGKKSLYHQVFDQIKANPEKIEDWAAKRSPWNFELKDSPVTMITSNVSGLAGIVTRTVDTAIAHPALPTSLMLAYGRTFLTDSAQILYSDWSAIQNAALTPITEGNGKTQQSATLTVSTSSYKELGSYMKVSDRMLKDIPFITSEITTLLTDYLINSVETALLTTTSWGLIGSSGIAPAYTDTSFDGLIYGPNVLDVAIACVVQIAKANFYPNLIVLNPSDFGRLLMDKTTTHEYTVGGSVYTVAVNGSSVMINGIPVVMSNRITADKILVGDFTKANIGLYGGVNVEMGWDGSDFTNNLRTIKAWQHVHLYTKTNEKPAFVYGDITDIITQISNGS